MQTIKLTNMLDGVVMRLNVDQIVAYGANDEGGSDVITAVHKANRCVTVKETAEEIDKLSAEAP